MKKTLFPVLIALAFGAAGWFIGSKVSTRPPRPQVSTQSVPIAHINFFGFNKLVAKNAVTGTLKQIQDQGVFFYGNIALPKAKQPFVGLARIDGFRANVSARDLSMYKAHHLKNDLAVYVHSGHAASSVAPAHGMLSGFWHEASDSMDAFLDVAIIAFVLVQLKVFRPRSRKVEHPTATFQDVAGLTGPKEEVKEIVEYLKNPKHFAQTGARPPRGILLYGPPGNGKTLLAKAVAGEAGITFIEQNASSFIKLFAGTGAMAVRSLFSEARKNAPCVIFIDEIDAVGGHRFGGAHSHEERLQTLNALLAEMDGMQENRGIVVMAATNQPDALDPALLRPGRFDRKVMIPLPGREDRRQILAFYLAKIKAAPNLTLDTLVRQSTNFSAADLANWANEAAIEASRSGSMVVTSEHFKAARDRILVGPRNHGVSLSEKERNVTAWHEAGHAIVRLATGGKVDKVSILPRGHAMGVTISLPDEGDAVFKTKDTLDRELQVLMGGRAAEELYCGEISTGAGSDMAHASAIARSGILKHGFGDFGPYVPESPKLIEQGELMAAEWVKSAYVKAKETLSARRDEITALRDRLLKEEEVVYDT